MWKTSEPPRNTRVLVSVGGKKIVIGRWRPSWNLKTKAFGPCEWSFDGKTTGQTKDWPVDGWQELPKPMGWVERPPPTYLDTLEFTVRSRNALEAAGLTSKEQILSLSYEDVLALPNVGKLSADEIIKWRDKPSPLYAGK